MGTLGETNGVDKIRIGVLARGNVSGQADDTRRLNATPPARIDSNRPDRDAVPATSVIGLQWGDEAKGKIVDLLTEDHDIVVRYQGGNNAGHTVQFDGQTYKLSLLPAGILRPGVESVVTGGVVINPRAFLEERLCLGVPSAVSAADGW